MASRRIRVSVYRPLSACKTYRKSMITCKCDVVHKTRSPIYQKKYLTTVLRLSSDNIMPKLGCVLVVGWLLAGRAEARDRRRWRWWWSRLVDRVRVARLRVRIAVGRVLLHLPRPCRSDAAATCSYGQSIELCSAQGQDPVAPDTAAVASRRLS